MKINIPQKLKVGGLFYTVQSVPARDTAKGYNSLGLTNHNTLEILIDNSLSKEKQELTFLHEILHTCFDHSGMNVDYEPEEEEKIVNRLSNALYMVLSENDILLK